MQYGACSLEPTPMISNIDRHFSLRQQHLQIESLKIRSRKFTNWLLERIYRASCFLAFWLGLCSSTVLEYGRNLQSW